MSTEYPTIQQHQPLRTPAGWDKQEKALILQLDETFDDIYRRFGRLRMEDMGKKFRKQIADDEGHIAQMALDISGLTIEVGNKISKTTTYQTAESIVMAAESYTDTNAYGKVSGITIDVNGIDITGNKYVKIESGGVFNVDSSNMIVDSTYGAIVLKKTFGNVPTSFALGNADTQMQENAHCQIGTGQGSTGNGQNNYYYSFLEYVDRQTDPLHRYETKMDIGTKVWGSDDNYVFRPSIVLKGYEYGQGNSYTRDLYVYITGELYALEMETSALSAYTGVFRTSVTSPSYITSSSRDIKHNIIPEENTGEIIDSLKPVTFVYDNDPDERTRHGLIYEDTIEVLPEICTGDESNKAINYIDTITIMLKEIQELRARVASLEGGQTNG